MKIDTVKLIIGAVLALILGYIFYLIAPPESSKNIVAGISAAICSGILLVPALAISLPDAAAKSFNAKFLAWIFLLVMLCTELFLSLKSVEPKYSIVVMLLETVVAVWLAYSIVKK